MTEDLSLRLGDFGLAVKTSEKLDNICGSIDYIAPEIIERQSDYYDGKAVDIYAMGICLFILQTSTPLYQIEESTKPTSPLDNSFYCRFMLDPIAELERRNLTIEPAALDLIFNMIHPDPGERLTLE